MSVHLSKEISLVTRQERETLGAHRGRVLWFTGLSGSGKSTLARSLEKTLFEKGIRTYILDGDNLRAGLNQDLGFSDADRKENIRRVAEVSKLMVDAGVVVIAAFISPKKELRQMAREIIGEDDFSEIFVDCDLETCMDRDPKGFYARAKSGEIKNYTGLDSGYEKPENPDLLLNTSRNSEAQSLQLLCQFYGI